MHKLEVTLKQHTPLIHFQHDQEGATLRASEVKPKLDRFILTKLGGNPTDEQMEAGIKQHQKEKITKSFDEHDDYEKGYFVAKGLEWLIGKGDKPALNYKMRIEVENLLSDKMRVECKKDKKTNELKYNTPYPLVVCNLNKSSADEILNFSIAESVQITFLTEHEELFKALKDKDNLNDFFGLHNFGNRQNKGFGCFTVDKIGTKSIKFDDVCYCIGSHYLEIGEQLNYRETFDAIEQFWKGIKKTAMKDFIEKAGNDAERIPSTVYFKPLLFEERTCIYMIYNDELREDNMMNYFTKKYPNLSFSIRIKDKSEVTCTIKQF